MVLAALMYIHQYLLSGTLNSFLSFIAFICSPVVMHLVMVELRERLINLLELSALDDHTSFSNCSWANNSFNSISTIFTSAFIFASFNNFIACCKYCLCSSMLSASTTLALLFVFITGVHCNLNSP
eukprot:NODE_135_length_18075_cov_0.518413.p13 type:complete len:126 gc:universal NODE_135_length_18075_cov_0.518413:8887-9264(+)